MTERQDTGQAARAAGSIRNYVFANMVAGVATLLRPPRDRRRPTSGRGFATYAALAAAVAGASMLWFDAPAIAEVATWPHWIVWLFGEITRFGLSGWFLVPLGTLLVAAAFVDGPWMPQSARLLLGTVTVRLGFLFVAVAVPGLINNLLKRVIGRARPSQLGPYFYDPLAWRAAFESLPSGHATTAFSVLVAFGAVFPDLRWLLWLYALVIAASRVIVQAHYPSDVVAGAALGGLMALAVRDWCARRRLGLYIGSDGKVRPLPAASPARLKGVARRLSAP